MKTTTSPSPVATSANIAPPSNPPISLVPEPTTEEQLAKARSEIDRLELLNADNKKRNDDLLEKLEEIERNTFSTAMAYMDGGGTLEDVGLAMKGLCESVMDRQEKGTLTLKIAVKPFKNAVVMTSDIKVTEPKKEPAQAIFYLNPEGRLQRNDPTQGEFRFSRGDRSSEGDSAPYADEPPRR